jgi:hypothetical protein
MATRRRGTKSGRRRNTAPAWKKLAVVLSAPLAVVVVQTLLDATKWNFFLSTALIVATAAAAVWLTAKLLGVHLSLGSWD